MQNSNDLDDLRANTNLADVVGRYVELRRNGREYEGCCPFHSDKTPSFTLFTGRDGIGRFHCHGCGERGDVLDFICKIENVSLPEAVRRLGGDQAEFPAAPRARPEPIPDAAADWTPILPVPDDAPAYDPAATFNPKRDRVSRLTPRRTDAYRDQAGRLLGYVVRCQFDDGGKWTPTITYCAGPDGRRAWAMRPFPSPRPLQGLDDLAARPSAPVLLVEGEKAASAAREALPGFVVVTWPGGTNGVTAADWSPLAGRRITFWPDADEPGHKAMHEIAQRIPSPGELRWLNTDGLDKGADVADLAPTMTTADLIAWAKARVGPYQAPAKNSSSPGKSEPEQAPEKGAGPGKRAESGRNRAAAPGPGSSPPEPANPDRGIPAAPSATLVGEVVNLPARGTAPAPAEGGAYSTMISWSELGLELSDRGVPHPNLDNAAGVLQRHPETRGAFWYDEFLQRVLSTWNADHEPREWTDSDDVRLALWMQRRIKLGRMAVGTVRDAVTAVATAHVRNECREWLESLKWDGTPRLHLLLPAGFGAESSPYTEAVGRCWLISMAARVLSPGCKVDTMPVFEGAQGRGKSTALQVLVGTRWFAEASESPTNKDFFQALTGKLLVEIGEMDAFSRSEVHTIKRVITCQSDRYRAPYGRRAEDHPRQGVFAGTTNKDDWNRDETGARRFWPVACTVVDLDWIARQREQLFAEAVALYRAGTPWWDVPAADAAREQEARRQSDEWEAVIALWLVGRSETSVGDVLEGALKVPPDKWDRSMQMRVASALRVLGWAKRDAWRGGKAVKIWISPNSLDIGSKGGEEPFI